MVVIFLILFPAKIFTRLETGLDIQDRTKKIIRTVLLTLLFGGMAIFATLRGIDFMGAVANARDLAPLIAGMLGGPVAGIGAGLIGGVHRFFYGGFTSTPCGIATIIAGLVGGVIYRLNKGNFISPLFAVILGIAMESFHMLLVLLISRPFDQALLVVKNLALPMIVSNALGLGLFSLIIQNYIKKHIIEAAKKKTENELGVVNLLQTSILPSISSEMKEEPEMDFSFEELIPFMAREVYKKGIVLFNKDDKADKIFYIQKGLMKLVEINKIVGEGTIIGETGIFSPYHKRTLTAVCETDLEVFAIDQEKIFKVLYQSPSLLLGLLQLSIKRFSVNLKETIAEKEQIESELKIARSIQASMLPTRFPERKDIDIFAIMEPAWEVGGDFYDFFFIDKNKICMIIGDVSGKGITAALFMVISKTLLKTESLRGLEPGDILFRVNNLLYPDNEECMFVTVFCSILDLKTGELQYANAGHNPPLLYTDSDGFQFIDVNKGFVLAGMDNTKFVTEKMYLKSDDLIFLYTDGVTEAMNPDQKQFSNNRLLQTLSNLKGKKVQKCIEGVREEVRSFVKEETQSDDITMLALKYNGNN
ncbi:MAG: SpoIIE family protein phosphatase [Spirochaetes bacterium]|nr:SpoIIE family protein phosphatase [Spirochaetota bacterium]